MPEPLFMVVMRTGNSLAGRVLQAIQVAKSPSAVPDSPPMTMVTPSSPWRFRRPTPLTAGCTPWSSAAVSGAGLVDQPELLDYLGLFSGLLSLSWAVLTQLVSASAVFILRNTTPCIMSPRHKWGRQSQ